MIHILFCFVCIFLGGGWRSQVYVCVYLPHRYKMRSVGTKPGCKRLETMSTSRPGLVPDLLLGQRWLLQARRPGGPDVGQVATRDFGCQNMTCSTTEKVTPRCWECFVWDPQGNHKMLLCAPAAPLGFVMRGHPVSLLCTSKTCIFIRTQ